MTGTSEITDHLGDVAHPAGVMPGLRPFQVSVLRGGLVLAECAFGLQQADYPSADSRNVSSSGRRPKLEPTSPIVVLDDLIADNGEQFLPAQGVQPGTEITCLVLAAACLALAAACLALAAVGRAAAAAVGRAARPPPDVARSLGRSAPPRSAGVAHDRQPDSHAMLAEKALLPIRATAFPP